MTFTKLQTFSNRLLEILTAIGNDRMKAVYKGHTGVFAAIKAPLPAIASSNQSTVLFEEIESSVPSTSAKASTSKASKRKRKEFIDDDETEEEEDVRPAPKKHKKKK